MSARTIPWSGPASEEILHEIASHLEAGGLLGYPTETVYGLGAAVDPRGIERVRALKHRGSERPFLVLLPQGPDDGAPALSWTPEARALATRFWPGPLTLVLGDPQARWPLGVRSAAGGVAVRVSSHPFVRALMAVRAKPLISTSANRPGEPPARSGEELSRRLGGDPAAAHCWIVDAGRLPPSPPSTLVDCTDRPPALLRRGAIDLEEIRAAAGAIDDRAN